MSSQDLIRSSNAYLAQCQQLATRAAANHSNNNHNNPHLNNNTNNNSNNMNLNLTSLNQMNPLNLNFISGLSRQLAQQLPAQMQLPGMHMHQSPQPQPQQAQFHLQHQQQSPFGHQQQQLNMQANHSPMSRGSQQQQQAAQWASQCQQAVAAALLGSSQGGDFSASSLANLISLTSRNQPMGLFGQQQQQQSARGPLMGALAPPPPPPQAQQAQLDATTSALLARLAPQLGLAGLAPPSAPQMSMPPNNSNNYNHQIHNPPHHAKNSNNHHNNHNHTSTSSKNSPSVVAKTPTCTDTKLASQQQSHGSKLDQANVRLLESLYRMNDEPEDEAIELIADRLGCPQTDVAGWFKLRREADKASSASSSVASWPQPGKAANPGNNNYQSLDCLNSIGSQILNYSNIHQSILETMLNNNNNSSTATTTPSKATSASNTQLGNNSNGRQRQDSKLGDATRFASSQQRPQQGQQHKQRHPRDTRSVTIGSSDVDSIRGDDDDDLDDLDEQRDADEDQFAMHDDMHDELDTLGRLGELADDDEDDDEFFYDGQQPSGHSQQQLDLTKPKGSLGRANSLGTPSSNGNANAGANNLLANLSMNLNAISQKELLQFYASDPIFSLMPRQAGAKFGGSNAPLAASTGNSATVKSVQSHQQTPATINYKSQQPSVPSSSFLAKLSAVTSRPTAHIQAHKLDAKMIDLLEAFYKLNDNPEPSAVEMIARRMNAQTSLVADWFDSKRFKLNPNASPRSPPAKKREGGRVVTFSEYQRGLLEAIFDENNYLHPQEYEELSNLIQVPSRNIKIWFKNRRSKQRLSGKSGASSLGASVSSNSGLASASPSLTPAPPLGACSPPASTATTPTITMPSGEGAHGAASPTPTAASGQRDVSPKASESPRCKLSSSSPSSSSSSSSSSYSRSSST